MHIYVYVYMSSNLKKEILPFVPKCINLEDSQKQTKTLQNIISIMVTEISQTETNTVQYHLYVDSERKKKVRLTETKSKVVAEVWGMGVRKTEVSTKAQIFSCNINKV